MQQFFAKKLYNTSKVPTYENTHILDADEFDLQINSTTNINGVYIKNPTANKTILVCPALMQLYENNTMGCLVTKLYNNRFDVYLFNYPGMSKSTGNPNPDIIRESTDTMYKFIRGRIGYDRTLFIYGRSMGASVASYIANTHPEVNLILDAPNLKLSQTAYEAYDFPLNYMIRYIIQKWFDFTIELDNYAKPFTIIRAIEDEVVPAYHAIDLKNSFKFNVNLVVMPGGHGFKITSWHEMDTDDVNTKLSDIIKSYE